MSRRAISSEPTPIFPFYIADVTDITFPVPERW